MSADRPQTEHANTTLSSRRHQRPLRVDVVPALRRTNQKMGHSTFFSLSTLMLSPQAHVIISQFLNVRVASTTQRCQRPFRCSEGDRTRQISNKERSAAEGDRTRSQRHAHVTHCTYKSWTSSVGFLCHNLYVAGSSNVTPVRPLQKSGNRFSGSSQPSLP